jgi:hypothetical protein
VIATKHQLHSLSWLEPLKTTSLFPLSTTFVHILAQGGWLSKGKFQQIIEKAGVSADGGEKHNLSGQDQGNPQQNVLTWLIQVARDVLVKCTKFGQAE